MRTRMMQWLLALVMAMVGGIVAVAATGTDEAEAATQRTLHIPASAFTPRLGGIGYNNLGLYVQQAGGTVGQYFHAPVWLEGETATVHSVTLHYLDRGPSGVCAYLRRPKPNFTGYKTMAAMCTRGDFNSIRAKTDSVIQPDFVGVTTTPYVEVTLPPGGAYRVYGVTIVYTSNG